MNTEIQSLYDRLGSTLTADEEREFLSVCLHESAHGLVATQLGLDSEEFVAGGDAGVCVHRKGSALQNAAVSWAGVMAEALFNAPHKSRTLPKIQLTSLTLCRWVDAVRLHELSKEDRDGIQSHPNRYESARTSFEILQGSLDALEYLAKSLSEKSRKDFVESTFRSAKANELEIAKFVEGQTEIAARKAMDKKLHRAMVDGDAILSSLPPCRVPTQFDIESFKSATGASDQEIKDFCFYRVQRERWQVGLGAPSPEAVSTAVEFFRENCVCSRQTWIQAARDFYKFRKGELRIV